MIITTLPLCYREGRSFKIFYTPFVAKCVSNITDGKLVLPINIMGIRDTVPTERHGTVVKSYGNALNGLFGPRVTDDRLFVDTQVDFLDFVRNEIETRLRSGILTTVSQDITFCGCGAIEVPTKILEMLDTQGRMKLVTKHGTSRVCKLCGNPLQTKATDVLVHNYANNILGCPVLPGQLSNRTRGILRGFTEYPTIVSRHYRTTEGALNLSNGMMIDPDYCWGHYINFLKHQQRESEFVIVVGANHLTQAYRTVVLTRSLDPGIRMTVLVHPLINIVGIDTQNTKMTIMQFLEVCGSPASAQLLFSLGLQWNRFNTTIPYTELALIHQGLEKYSPIKASSDSTGLTKTLRDIDTHLKRDRILKVLKNLRKNRHLSSEDQFLLSSICQ